LSHKENFKVTWDDKTQKYIKTTEIVQDDLTDDQILNEYLGAIKERKKLLEDLTKNQQRLDILDVEFKEIFEEFVVEYASLDRGFMSMDELRALDEVKVKFDLLVQVREHVKKQNQG
jgi:hypothetical protein